MIVTVFLSIGLTAIQNLADLKTQVLKPITRFVSESDFYLGTKAYLGYIKAVWTPPPVAAVTLIIKQRLPEQDTITPPTATGLDHHRERYYYIPPTARFWSPTSNTAQQNSLSDASPITAGRRRAPARKSRSWRTFLLGVVYRFLLLAPLHCVAVPWMARPRTLLYRYVYYVRRSTGYGYTWSARRAVCDVFVILLCPVAVGMVAVMTALLVLADLGALVWLALFGGEYKE